MRTLKAIYKILGGVHPPHRKVATAGLAIETMPCPPRVVVSLAQHLGAPSQPIVKKGDAVLLGQPIASPAGFVSSWVHAPVSGIVKSVDEAPTATGRIAPTVELESDGQDHVHESCTALESWAEASAPQLMDQIARAGIIGMGGAGFPTHVKLSPPPPKRIDTLIINGAECEPYLTADHRLMLEQATRIWGGIRILRTILGAKSVHVAIEDNKPDAIETMRKAADGLEGEVDIVVLKSEYPQGAEKQLIYSVTGREIPSGGLPMDVGALVENVATAAAVYEAVAEGRPLTRRVVTVGGDCVRAPKNLLARVGTPLQALVEFCGGVTTEPAKLLCGGPMMGLALSSLAAGLGKTTSGLLLLSEAACRASEFTSLPCIGCGRCVAACPMRLLPCTLSECAEAEDFAGTEEYHVMDCIECGSCAYVCPAHRPLVQHMKQGKQKAMARRQAEKAKQKAS